MAQGARLLGFLLLPTLCYGDSCPMGNNAAPASSSGQAVCLHAGAGCASQSKNLGTGHATPGDCVAAAEADSGQRFVINEPILICAARYMPMLGEVDF